MSSGISACDIVPTINPERATPAYQTFPDRFRSPQSGFQRTKRRWSMWTLRYAWANLEADQALPLLARFNWFIAADMPFKIYDVTRPQTTGVATQGELATVAAVSAAEGQRGREINLKNLPANKLCFRAGDLIGGSVNGEMYEVAEDFTSVGTTGTVKLTNYVRNSLAVGADEPIYTAYVPVKVLGEIVAPDITGGQPIYSFEVNMAETF